MIDGMELQVLTTVAVVFLFGAYSLIRSVCTFVIKKLNPRSDQQLCLHQPYSSYPTRFHAGIPHAREIPVVHDAATQTSPEHLPRDMTEKFVALNLFYTDKGGKAHLYEDCRYIKGRNHSCLQGVCLTCFMRFERQQGQWSSDHAAVWKMALLGDAERVDMSPILLFDLLPSSNWTRGELIDLRYPWFKMFEKKYCDPCSPSLKSSCVLLSDLSGIFFF